MVAAITSLPPPPAPAAGRFPPQQPHHRRRPDRHTPNARLGHRAGL